jgi:hypothetical protein
VHVERLPDFFIVGQPKSGTTALYEMLRHHPQIYMPDSKEPWYFADELLERSPPRPGGTPTTLAQYTAMFAEAQPGQRAGEASAFYLWSQTAARRIAEVAPEAKIIAIMREPASFLRSLHLQLVQVYVETEADFRRAIELEQARRRGEFVSRYTYWPKAILYSDHVRYVEQLRRFQERFGRERMLVLIYDDFRADNETTVRRVLRFLDVDDGHPIRVTEANPTVEVRSQRLNELIHAVSVGRGPLSHGVKAAIKAISPRRLRRRALHATKERLLYAQAQPVDEELMLSLRRRYKPEVVALSEYLERDLISLWGYDRI